ncbi:MAG TPA: benzaldehyde dehydrogenase [Acidobacteriaceae bacterium]|jgi:benzaldehyde dehydrogenase (NAD)|nr:benzaldehyde dehydrogenase [Acidobacteriaceae bacterium]
MTTTPSIPTAETVWTNKLYSDGWRAGSAGTIDVIEPATGEVLATVGAASPNEVATAAKSALVAQAKWAAMLPNDRAAILFKAAEIFEKAVPEMSLFIARETGGLLAKGQREVHAAAHIVQAAASMPLQPQGLVLPQMTGNFNFAQRVPRGVIAVISPFNFPLILSIRAVAPALAVGNAVILKPDPQTPIGGGLFIAKVFEEAGLPEGLLHVLPGGADVGEALCTDPNISMVSFTGSTAAGRKVGEICGRHLKKVALELGGKNPLIVLDDADVDVAASNAAWGSYLFQGQICMSTGIVFAHAAIAEKLTAKLSEKAKGLRIGNPATEQVAIGPMINQRQRDRVHAIVQEAVQQGAKLAAGGTYKDLFYAPTVLSGVRPGMRAFEEEIFGPVAVVVTIASDDEAVALANQSAYGLAAGILSKDVGRAMALGQRLKIGLLHINDQTVKDDHVNPFGGRGASGNGSSIGGPGDWEEFTQWQWVTMKKHATAYPF